MALQLSRDHSVPHTLRHADTGMEVRADDPIHYDRKSAWMTVRYGRRHELSREDRQRLSLYRRQRRVEMARIMSDPHATWRFRRDEEIHRCILRIRRQADPKFHGMSYKNLWRHVDRNMSRDDEPLILINPKMDKAAEEVQVPRRQGGARQLATVEKNAEEGNLTVLRFTGKFIDQVRSARVQTKIEDPYGEQHAMTQAQLGQAVNETENVIRDFELGTLPFDHKLAKKLRAWLASMELD